MPRPVTCQICNSPLVSAAESYDFTQIFQWWQEKGHHFSATVLKQYPGAQRTALITCSRCGFGIFYPTMVGTGEFYQELSNSGQGTYYARDTWEHRQALLDLKECQKILEIGCGAGFFLEKLKDQGKEVQGLELNAAAAAYARSRGISVDQAPIEGFAAAHKESFDAVCLFQVLEHVARPLDFLGGALAALKPRGRLIVSVPNMAGILGQMDPMVTNVPPHHVSRWTPETLSCLAQHFQLKVAAIKYEPVYNFLPAYLEERLRHLGVPAWAQGNKIYRLILSLPGKSLRTLKPGGLRSFPGHTVYTVLLKE